MCHFANVDSWTIMLGFNVVLGAHEKLGEKLVVQYIMFWICILVQWLGHGHYTYSWYSLYLVEWSNVGLKYWNAVDWVKCNYIYFDN